jgi:hypothetical protein
LLSVSIQRAVQQLVDIFSAALLLVVGVVFTELQDIVTNFGMGVDFNPSRDIASLEGRVIVVTGGTFTPFKPPRQAV